MHYNWNEYYSPKQLQVLVKTGFLIVEAQMLKKFAEINQQQLLNRVKCPILIIHGDNGEEERQLLERSRQGLCYLGGGSRLEVIHGANHSFLDIHGSCDLSYSSLANRTLTPLHDY
ncbi:hypothetical protein [Chlorogloeopsis sp. ULAP02]|uniref:hypothetical protein n=1 Tax=Chlorogloeopsis sp. ULAP02 TaxID=3107926 RepID=UPI0031371D83